ncbi:iron dicitrate transport regulator FecR [Pseudomonas putida]|nr:iron dicitrate transport regulator FecR [Pseudomonas putida]
MSVPKVDSATQAAVDWLLRLESVPPGDARHQAFEAWLSASPSNRHAWQRVNALLSQPLASLEEAEARSPGQRQAASRSLLAAPVHGRRKVLGGGLAMLLLGLGAGGIANRLTPLEGLFADLHSATGERKRVTLADGSELLLNARSAVDIRFDAAQRRVLIREGEVLVRVAADAARPFVIATAHGEARALGTQFLVRQSRDHSLVAVQQHSVRLTTRGGASSVVEEGQAARFDAQGIHPEAVSLRSRADWQSGQLVVHDEPLGEVVEVLRRYRPGLLRISPQAAQVRVFGVFSLDDSDATLHALAETLPIRLEQYGGWLTRIETR